jgi:group II intron reverse transcriptase/maturase
MEQRFNDFRDGKIDMRALHPMVYDTNNVALALRQLSQSKGRMALGPDKTNFKTLEPYSIDELSEIVKDRLLSKKMSYVRRTYIPKGNTGKKRPLGICSIWDKLVEKCIQLVVEPFCETKFVPSSFGFRPQVSTHNALAKVKNQCETMPFVLSVDLKDYFGTLDPNIAYRELWHIGVKDQVILNYIFRFIKKGYFEDSCKVEDPRGTPQGSILGPLISNVYLHRFDVWLRDQGDCWHDSTAAYLHDYANKRRNILRTTLKLGIHVRYADDILVLCKTREHAERFRYSVTRYLTQNMKLEINGEKTKIYDIAHEKMKYLGYDFLAVTHNCKNPQQQGKYRINNTLPKAKEDEITEKCRILLKAIRKNPTYATVHDWNAYVVGLHNYYRGMNYFHDSFRQIGWRIMKLFYHTMNRNVKFTKEQSYKNGFQNGVYSSWGKDGYYCYETYPIFEIWWANWDKKLIAGYKCKVTRENPYAYGEKKHKPGVSIEDIGYLVETSKPIRNSRYAMFRISKYSSTKGVSYLSGEHVPVDEYHCHHIIPQSKNGTNDFDNLCVLSKTEHLILHSNTPERLYSMFPRKIRRIKALIDAL